jgi:hypothetical protein
MKVQEHFTDLPELPSAEKPKPETNSTVFVLANKYKSKTIDKKIFVLSTLKAFEQFLVENRISEMDNLTIRTIKSRLEKMCNTSQVRPFQHVIITEWIPTAKVRPNNKRYAIIFKDWYSNNNI